MNNPGRWRTGAITSAIALLGCLASLDAHALALGRITVQSGLGEPLRAEIDISDLKADVASSLKIGVAGADVFKASGLEYSAAVAGLDVKLQRRPDGRAFLRVSSSRDMTEPFMDLVLEARWAAGQLTRDYTLLFDPPSLSNSSSAAAVVSRPLVSREPAVIAGPGSGKNTPAPFAQPAGQNSSPAPRPVQNPPGDRQVTVRPGDNASRIAARNKPESVSLDQMLVAMLKGNPEAFVGGNINLIKSGAVVDIPDAQAANALSPAEAKQTLVVQSRDFNAFRSKLAAGVPAVQLDTANRRAGGKVQTQVDDRAQVSASPDRLTLSKSAIQVQQAEEQLAKNTAGVPADLTKNSTDLKSPAAANTLPGAPVAMPAAGTNAVAGGAPAITAMPALGVASAAGPAASSAASVMRSEALAPGSEPVSAVSASSAAASQSAVLTVPAALPAEPGLVDQIADNPWLLGSGFLLALLAALGFSRYRKNAKSSQVDSSFLDSRLQPDSFFGASGGQRVDTSAGKAPVSPAVSSLNQLDASGDVDPVAEADVYLAYGRDHQAEEILKEALRTQPTRLSIHTKLTEIYAKRRDHKAFEGVALTVFKLSGGQGPEWDYISQAGRELEPGNPMYTANSELSSSLLGNYFSDLAPLSTTVPQALVEIPPAAKAALVLDLDLDIDLSMGQAPTVPKLYSPDTAGVSAASLPSFRSNTSSAQPSAFLDRELNLDGTLDAAPVAADQSGFARATGQPFKPTAPEIDYLAGELDFMPVPDLPAKASPGSTAPVDYGGMMEFDLDSLSADFEPAKKPPVKSVAQPEKDPLEIKFLLAEEFRMLGDSEGARSLAHEVATHASDPLKSKAQAFLSTLS